MTIHVVEASRGQENFEFPDRTSTAITAATAISQGANLNTGLTEFGLTGEVIVIVDDSVSQEKVFLMLERIQEVLVQSGWPR